MGSHAKIDDRSLALGRAVAVQLAAQPRLVIRARANIDRWLTTCSAAARPALLEWRAVLDGPLDEVVAILRGTDEHAIRLRQSNPFAGVLSPAERNAILRRYDRHDAAST